VVLACEDDAALEAFPQALLAYGRYKVASEMRRVKD
jgi:Lrp/AsnC family leucine-responsive transcriptional regulator